MSTKFIRKFSLNLSKPIILLTLTFSSIVVFGTELNCAMINNGVCEIKSTPKPHLERYQIFYASLLGILSAVTLFLFQQNFSRWWITRTAWKRVHAMIAAYLNQLDTILSSGRDAATEIRIDLSWVIRHAAESGIDSVRLAVLLETVADIDWVQHDGSRSETLSDLQAKVKNQIETWKTRS